MSIVLIINCINIIFRCQWLITFKFMINKVMLVVNDTQHLIYLLNIINHLFEVLFFINYLKYVNFLKHCRYSYLNLIVQKSFSLEVDIDITNYLTKFEKIYYVFCNK